MNENFYRDRAKTVRDIAEKAGPSTKKRLLELADRYDRKPRPPTPLPLMGVPTATDKSAPD